MPAGTNGIPVENEGTGRQRGCSCRCRCRCRSRSRRVAMAMLMLMLCEAMFRCEAHVLVVLVVLVVPAAAARCGLSGGNGCHMFCGCRGRRASDPTNRFLFHQSLWRTSLSGVVQHIHYRSYARALTYVRAYLLTYCSAKYIIWFWLSIFSQPTTCRISHATGAPKRTTAPETCPSHPPQSNAGHTVW
jgi:hypothetical protein